ncbi:DHH family phosphoesterase [Candidatus Phytoplasma phoenicium]|uniref:Phosphoesterase family protein, RecJ-like n=1 Tax=Candidatus Phytoplasma phoenicium TaxID=198422 RepID=A0A0L0MJM5_9MOLU|nr:bifunctional oligoribonuclease/PAP phosphatase NrnA [Candidatus Phytoplasma phoenicium]KND62548.1 Phosphoesterase family protein, RecJ-like [Candidatus Phytoplasma phoenicium]
MKYIKEQINKFDTIIIHGHIRPDGDCYGSQFGLKDIILTSFPYKKVYVVGETNPKLEFLGKMDIITDEIYQKALVLIVDCGTSVVISEPRYKLGKKIIRIDHHLLVEKIGHYQWIDSSFSSCSEMMFHFKEKCNLKLSFNGAISIYVGMVSDTGSFRFQRVNSETFRIVSELLKNYSFNISEIDQKINKNNINMLKFQGYVCNNFQAEKGVLYIKIIDEIVEELNLSIEEIFSKINILSNVEGYPLWAFIKKLTTNKWKISIRSSGPQISHIAHQFGGGGHQHACGIIVANEEQVDAIISLMQENAMEFNKKTK